MSTLNAGETLQPFKPLNQLIYDSAGNLIGIQNDRANGSDLRIGGGSGVDGTFATLVATTALKLNSGATFDLYNTADQTTNYERLRASFVSNRAEVGTFFAGTGTPRQMRVGAGNASTLSSFLGFYSQQFPFIEAVIPNTAGGGVLVELFKGTFTGSLGTQTIASIQPTFNQSGTAAYTALDVNPTESATGSGTKLLQRWAVGGSQKGYIDNAGNLWGSNLGTAGSLAWSNGFGSSDVFLQRDAANVLAQRSSTSAQTFRVYNTYTDASNNEYITRQWSSNICYDRTVANGTGTRRLYIPVTWGTTVAGLPSLTANDVGARSVVTDSIGNTFCAIVAGGGANVVPVFWDGTQWRNG